jgi:hypothetical protein
MGELLTTGDSAMSARHRDPALKKALPWFSMAWVKAELSGALR